ncbi:50S ribosome-binding protein YggL [Curvibacter fontanus]
MVTRPGRSSVSESQRLAVLSWLRARSEIAQVRASELFDIWYADDEGVMP